jgi:DNA polymerase-1
MNSSRNGPHVTPADLPFEEIWLHDFEFVPRPGECPDVVCLAARELRSGRTLCLWRDKLGERPPYRTDRGVLFVNFVANAECACHLALGWPLPANVLDLSPAFRNLTNGRSTPEGKGLLGALRYFGLDTIDIKYKEAMQKRVMQGWPFTPEEREQILKYCASDTDALALLLPFMLKEIDLDIALHHSEFAAVSALMEHRGVPIDMEVFLQLQDKHVWSYVRDAVVPRIDSQYGVYVKDKSGDWSFNTERFESYLTQQGIDWPRLVSGKLNLRRKTFENMTRGWPELEDLRQLRHARDKMRRIKLAVGADGRNRTVLWPFKAKTSRTQPKASQWIFSPAVWLRSLIKPEPGRAVAYIDYSAMEFMLAAVLSASTTMVELYQSGDPYLEFAKRVGAVPPWATRKTHGKERELYKVMLLATQYGMQAETLAARLGTSLFAAHEMLNQHRGLCRTYWAWSDDWVAHALDTGIMRSPLGWTCRTGITEFNERSIRNWPVQTIGGDCLRVACVWASRYGLELVAPVHDAVAIEAPIERIEADVALMREIMRRASRVVLNAEVGGPYELRTDAEIVRYPDRYHDKRGEKIWAEVLGLLAAYQQKDVSAANEAG